MEFVRKKLSLADGEASLRPHPTDAWAPYTLLFAPVYVPLQSNGKFIAVKGPLDFFTPEELKKYQRYPQLYFHESIDDLQTFQDAGRSLRTLLDEDETGTGLAAQMEMNAAPFELSNSVLKVLGPLCGPELAIEPFFLVVLVNEICGPFPPELLEKGRDADVSAFELGILRASAAVFVALLLGIMDLFWLKSLRLEILEEALGLRRGVIGPDEPGEIRNLVKLWIPEATTERIEFKVVAVADRGRVALKTFRRLDRVKREMAPVALPPPSLKGPRGFQNV